MNTARDVQIVALRKRGYTLTRIADHVGMSPAGVYRALNRLAGIPRKRSDPRDDLSDVIADDDDRQFWTY